MSSFDDGVADGDREDSVMDDRTSERRDSVMDGEQTAHDDVPSGEPAPASPDPERGLRGVFSAVLVLEAIAILLGLTVLAPGGEQSAPLWQILVVLALGFAHILTPALIKKAWVLGLIAALQVLVVACWAFSPAIGITGVVFVVVWGLLLWMRREYRRRVVSGALRPPDQA